MNPPVDAPTSTATSPRRVDGEGVERGDQLVRPPADPLAPAGDRDRGLPADEVARLEVVPGAIALAHPDLPGQHERLGAGARSAPAHAPRGAGPAGCAGRLLSPCAYRGTGASPGTYAAAAALMARGRSGQDVPARDRTAAALDPQLGERLVDLGGEPGHVEADEAPQVRHRAVVDEPVARDADDLAPAIAR